jgi:hypothetical protein
MMFAVVKRTNAPRCPQTKSFPSSHRLADDVGNFIIRAAVRAALPMSGLADTILAGQYDLAEPTGKPSEWTAELLARTNDVAGALAGLHGLSQRNMLRVRASIQ